MSRAAPLDSLSTADNELAGLTDEQRLRLTDVLDRYLLALEQGRPLAPAEVLRQHADLAPVLANYFQSLEDLHDMAAGFGGAASRADDEDQSAAGTRRLGDFELLRELGRGGMGVVYEARQLSLDRCVALKILPFAAVLDSRQIARFQHEAQAAAQLHHPHIVPVFAVGVERGVHYYAMQLVNGQSLEELIESRREERRQRKRCRRGPEEFQTIARLGHQAAEALQAAHDVGIVHRDIKPSNLLLDAAGKLWVTDFGLARMQRDVSLTRSGDLVGTLRYMSPEQASGAVGVVDERSDVYSLGATLYELATLRPAYGEENSAALLRAIETRDPVSPRSLRAEIPLDLENIIRRAMARERIERYPSAAELAADLQRFIDGQPTRARAATLSERLTRWSQRRARGLAFTTTALVALVVLLSVGLLLIVRAQRQSRAQLARAERYSREAREVLDRFGTQLAERLANVAGAESVRRDLLLEASNYYRRFIADSEQDPARRDELALAYGRLASLLDEVGTSAEALAAHERAVEYLERSVSAGDAEKRSRQQRQLAIARNNLAVALRRTGQPKRAVEQLELAKASKQKLEPTNHPEIGRELATTYLNLGLAHQDAGFEAGAAEAIHNAVMQLHAARTTGSQAAETNRPVATAYAQLAAAHKEREPQLALGLYQQAIALLEPITIQSAEDRRAQTELANAYHGYATLLTRAKQYAEAIAAFDRAIAQQRELLETSPGNAHQHSDLGSMLSNRGVAQAGAGDLPSAADSLQQAVEQQRLALTFTTAKTSEATRIRDLVTRHERLLATYQQKLAARIPAATERQP